MITKEDYENAEAIEEDKSEFVGYALNRGFKIEDIFYFENYQNLISFEDNLNNLKEVLK